VRSGKPRLAVVGHVEWVQFARVDRVPLAGEIAHAATEFEEPAGGGAVVAVALARLAGAATLFTALSDDELGARSQKRLDELGVGVRAVTRAQPTRRALTLVDEAGERTITTFGPRLDPGGADGALGWADLAEMDAVYFTAGDAAAMRAARAARVLVASPRARDALGAGVALDALILSSEDPTESAHAHDASAEAELVISTAGERGGSWRSREGREGHWTAFATPGPIVDTYGCGDAFAAGVTYGLGAGRDVEEAIALGARCAAASLAGAGPYAGPLTPALLDDD
jgi:ribokinase